MTNKKLIQLATGLLAGILLLACDLATDSSDPGPQESSHTGQMGDLVFGSLGKAGGLKSATSFSTEPPSLSGSTGLNQVQQSGKAHLAKGAAAAGCLYDTTVDVSDTAAGLAMFQVATECEGFRQTETVWVQWDDRARDDIDDNENIQSYTFEKEYSDGRIESARFTDLDGDGIANGAPEYIGRVRITFNSSSPSGIAETSVLDVDAGEDKDFDAEEDNLIIALSWQKTKEGELVGSATFTDADKDGILVKKDGLSLVKLELFEADNPLKPLVKSSSLDLLMEITPENEDGRVLSISGTETFKSGRVNKLTVEDAQGDAVIDPGDIATVTITSDFPTQGEDLHSELKLVIDVGAGLHDDSDNRIFELHAYHEKRFGVIASQEFHFVTEDPIKDGEEPTSGTVSAETVFRNGDVVTLNGTFAEGMLKATVTGPEGTITVTWDADGELLNG